MRIAIRDWRFAIRRKVPAQACIPRGYGVALRDYYREVAICYPVPLHIVVALACRAWWWIARGLRPTQAEHELRRKLARIEADAYDRGWAKGLVEGQNMARRELIAALQKQAGMHVIQRPD